MDSSTRRASTSASICAFARPEMRLRPRLRLERAKLPSAAPREPSASAPSSLSFTFHISRDCKLGCLLSAAAIPTAELQLTSICEMLSSLSCARQPLPPSVLSPRVRSPKPSPAASTREERVPSPKPSEARSFSALTGALPFAASRAAMCRSAASLPTSTSRLTPPPSRTPTPTDKSAGSLAAESDAPEADVPRLLRPNSPLLLDGLFGAAARASQSGVT
mmetsp:Transcript_40264/g.85957  ORF Transcript_40264/g.85957 Transcript_40264/m.85957 type:complete len:220 (-) Transcript_40264:487-1146(-)